MPTPSSTASSTTPIASISPATACDEPDQDQSQRIDPQLASRQNHPPAGRRLKRATSCRNTERHDLGTTGRHRRNQQSNNPAQVVSLLGWLMTIKGAALLLIPATGWKAFLSALHYPSHPAADPIIPALVGAYLIYAGFVRRR